MRCNTGVRATRAIDLAHGSYSRRGSSNVGHAAPAHDARASAHVEQSPETTEQIYKLSDRPAAVSVTQTTWGNSSRSLASSLPLHAPLRRVTTSTTSKASVPAGRR